MADSQSTTCPTDAKLHDFLAGRLPVPQMESLAQHFEQCVSCQERLEVIDDSDASIDRWASPDSDIPYAEETECGRAVAGIADSDTRPEVPSPRKAPPKQLGEYELLEPLGEGGMGAVYRARHATLGSICAIKLLHPQRQADRATIERFEREMVALGKLDHPHIVRAIDAGEDQGIHYLVMEFVRGVDLSEILQRRKQLSVADACEATRQAALGLGYVHRHGRVHRDVKPSNFMLTSDGNIKLLDLGLAQVEGVEFEEKSVSIDDLDLTALDELTRTNQIMGTIEYMAPEQASDTHSVDFRADIYSLGCTLYKLLTGQSPFASTGEISQLSQVLAHVQTPAPPIQEFRDDVPDDLARLIEHMLAKKPEGRPQSADKIAYELEPFCKQADLIDLMRAPVVQADTVAGSQQTTTKSPFGPTPAAKKPFPWVAAILTCCAVVMALGGIALYGMWATMNSNNLEVHARSSDVLEQLEAYPVWLVNATTGQRVMEITPGEYELPNSEYYLDSPTESPLEFNILTGEQNTFSPTPNQIFHITISTKPTEFKLSTEQVATRPQNGSSRNLPREPEPPEAQPSGPPVDLIPLIDPDRDFQNDAWQLVDDAIIGDNYQPSIMQIPYHPSDHYQLEATVERLGGDESLMIALVAGDQPLIISIDGWPQNGSYAGIYRLNGRNPTRQPSNITSRGQQLQIGKPAQVVATVIHRNGRANVQLKIDQKSIFTWGGNVSETGHSPIMYTHQPTALAIGKYKAPFKISELRVVPYAEGGKEIEFATPEENQHLAAAQRALWKGGRVMLQEAPAESVATSASASLQQGMIATELSQLAPEQQVAAIDMQNSNWVNDADLPYFAKLDTLQALHLSGSRVTLDGLSQLTSLPALRSLKLAQTHITDREASSESQPALEFPALEILDLSVLDIGDQTVAAFGELPKLEYLALHDTRITAECLAELKNSPKLGTLLLDRTPLTTADLEQLPASVHLKTLSLNETQVDTLAWLTVEKYPQLSKGELLNTQVVAEEVASVREAFNAKTAAGDPLAVVDFLTGYEVLAPAELVEADRDTILGTWTADSASLTVLNGNPARLALPIELPTEFDLSVSVTKKGGTNGPVFAMPLPDGTKVLLGFDHWPGEGGYTILHGIDGKTEKNSPAKTKIQTFPDNSTAAVQLDIHVRRHGEEIEVVAERDGEVVLNWRGDANRIRLGSAWFSPEQERLTVSVYNGQYVFDQLTVTPISGRITLHNPALPLNGPDREVAHWVLANGGEVVVNYGPGTANSILSSADSLSNRPFRVYDIQFRPGTEISRQIFQQIGTLSQLENLWLTGTKFDNADLELVSELTTLKRVFCSGSTLNDQGLEHLAKLVNLGVIHVSETEVTPVGFAHLENHRQLSHLTARLATLDDRAAETAATLPRLIHLSLATSQLSEAGLEALQGHPNLKYLYLGRCDNLRAVDMANLVTVQNLSTLDLSHDQLGPKACVSLGMMTSLERLLMFNNPIGDSGMQRLENLTNLVELHAGRMNISDQSMGTIGKFQQLVHLRLDENPNITDKSINTLVNLPNLKKLYIKNSGFTSAGVKRLRAALPRCEITSDYDNPTRRKLDLRDRGVTDDTLGLALQGDAPIVELKLGGEGITDKSLPLLAKLPALERLDFWRTGVTNQGVAALAESRSLKRLEFWHMPHITGEVTEQMADIPNLTTVTFKTTGVYGPGLERLHDTQVRNLHIGHYKLDGAMFEQYIVPFGKLDNLDLAGAAITDADIAKIIPLEVTNFLHLGFNGKIYGPGLVSIANMPQLRSLNLHKSPVDDAGLVYLAGADRLQKLDLRETVVSDASLELLASMSNLQELDLSDTELTAAGVAALRKRLPNTNIRADHLVQTKEAGVYPPAQGQQVAARGWKPSWSPDGKKLVYGIGNGEGLEIIDLETEGKQLIDIRAKDPAWSPRGDLIAFGSEPYHNSSKAAIWIIKPDGTGGKEIRPGTYPFWIDGGNTLVFYSHSLPGLVSYQIDTDSDPQPFYRNIPSMFADATDDGQYIAYSTDGHVTVVNRDTREKVWDLPLQDTGTGLPAFSPDGKSLAYAPFEGTEQGIWICLWQDHIYEQIIKGNYQSPTWSPDGNRLAFDYNRFGKPDQRELWTSRVLIKPVDKQSVLTP